LARLVQAESNLKVSHRDFATAIIKKASGGTTVAGTMFAARNAGIQVFATGGIGGVYKESAFDISTDLRALAEIPMIVVCAGAKAILDLPATLEYLETMGVPVVGYQTDEFPAFYSRESGLGVSVRLDTPKEIAEFAQAHWNLGMRSAVLVTNPVPLTDAIPKSENGTDDCPSICRSDGESYPWSGVDAVPSEAHQRVDRREILEHEYRFIVEQCPAGRADRERGDEPKKYPGNLGEK
jgi:pseudouridine-5'-phosphate glycosidase